MKVQSQLSNPNRQEVLYLLFMRYKIEFAEGMQSTEAWLKANPGETWDSLKLYLLDGKIVVKDRSLLDLRQIPHSDMLSLVQMLRNQGGLEIRTRRYNLKKYSSCFVGSEMVEWLQANRGASVPEALRLGQILIENKVIHHVHDDHDFKNEMLFYRFYEDEKA